VVDAAVSGGEDSCRSLDCARDDTSIHAAAGREVFGDHRLRLACDALLGRGAVGVEGRGGGGEPGVGGGGGWIRRRSPFRG